MGVVENNPGAVLIGAVAFLAFTFLVAIGALGVWSMIGGLMIVAALAVALGISWGEERNISPASVMLFLLGALLIAYDQGVIPAVDFNSMADYIPYIAAILLIVLGAFIVQYQPLAGGVLIAMGAVLIIGIQWWNTGGSDVLGGALGAASTEVGGAPLWLWILSPAGAVGYGLYRWLSGGGK